MASILNVDKIRAASGTTNVIDIDSSCNTTALTIDSSGRVLRPVIPYTFATFVNSGAYVSISADSILDFSVAAVNDGNHYNTSTYKFVCPVDGLYRVECSTLTQSNGDAYSLQPTRNSGGTVVEVGRFYTRDRSLSGSMTIKCSANDELYIITKHTKNFYKSTDKPYSWATYTFIG